MPRKLAAALLALATLAAIGGLLGGGSQPPETVDAGNIGGLLGGDRASG